VVLLGIKKIHGLHADQTIIWKQVNPWPLTLLLKKFKKYFGHLLHKTSFGPKNGGLLKFSD